MGSLHAETRKKITNGNMELKEALNKQLESVFATENRANILETMGSQESGENEKKKKLILIKKLS